MTHPARGEQAHAEIELAARRMAAREGKPPAAEPKPLSELEAGNAALEAENAALRAGIETAFNICKDSTDRAIRITVTCMLAGALQAFGDGKGGGVLLAAKALADASLCLGGYSEILRSDTCPNCEGKSPCEWAGCEWGVLAAAYRAALAAEKGADADGS